MTTRRKCQIQALEIVKSRYTAESETNLQLCTGAGKSIIEQDISLLCNSCIIVVPSLLLLAQYYRDHKQAYDPADLYYMATEGTLDTKDKATNRILAKVKRLSDGYDELSADKFVVLTTYASAPQIYEHLSNCEISVDMLIEDEAHHIEGPKYKEAFALVEGYINHRVRMSATLPSSLEKNYQYSLLRGIKDGVVRDFTMELVVCKSGERAQAFTKLVDLLIGMQREYGHAAKILVYTAFAEKDDASSVVALLGECRAEAERRGWWMKGIYDSMPGKKQDVLEEFETSKCEAAILVSCKTLSEGVDLKNANCMIPWDPTNSTNDNIQRIGRIVRLYKMQGAQQTLSTIAIPVFLDEVDYCEHKGDKEAIHAVLERQIALGERGNFKPIINVCTALKSELADKDEDLFNELLDARSHESSRVRVDKSLIDCVAKKLKKKPAALLEKIANELEIPAQDLKSEWSEDDDGRIIEALVKTQNITLRVDDGEEAQSFGSGITQVAVVRDGDSYKAQRESKGMKHAAKRLNVHFTADCMIMLGLEDVDIDGEKQFVFGRLTTEVCIDPDEFWEKRRQDWINFMKRSEGKYMPDLKSTDVVEKSLAIWMKNQIQNKRHRRITPERQTILSDDTFYWSWHVIDKWVEQYEHWCVCQRKYNRQLSQVASEEDERKAAKWQSMQRLDYKRKQDDPEKAPWLTDERIKALNETDGWTWGGFDEIWDRAFDNWGQVCSELDRSVNSKDLSESQKLAHRWQHSQRREKTTMSEYRRSKLDAAKYWSWNEKEDDWILRFEQLKVLGSKLNRVPTLTDDETLGRWCSKQREQYKDKEVPMPMNRINLLGSLTFWYWRNDNDAKWDVKLEAWKACYNESTGVLPDKRSSDPKERKAGQWQAQQRTKKKKLSSVRLGKLNMTVGWKWSEEGDASSVSSAENTIAPPPKMRVRIQPPAELVESVETLRVRLQQPPPAPAELVESVEPKPLRVRRQQPPPAPPATDESKPITIRRRKFKLPNPEAESSGRKQSISEIGTYHKRFHNLNSATYFAEICADPETFAAYHEVADRLDAMDAKDAPEQQVMIRLSAECAKLPPKCHIADLGCGKNRLRDLAPHCKWTSVDAVAIDDTVQVADLGNLPFEDFQFHAAILSRALWGRDHMKQMQEAYRILAPGALLIVCESKRRWLSDDGTNQLLEDIISAGFHIKAEPEAGDEVFQYIVAQKPALL